MFLKFLASATFSVVKMEAHIYLPELLGNSMMLYTSGVHLWLVVSLTASSLWKYWLSPEACKELFALLFPKKANSASHCLSFSGAWRAYYYHDLGTHMDLRCCYLAGTPACSSVLDIVLSIPWMKSKACLHCCKKSGRVRKGESSRSLKHSIDCPVDSHRVSRLGPHSVTSRL